MQRRTIALMFGATVLTTAWLASAPSRAADAPRADWTGIWTRVGSFSFDPSIRPEHRENPPYKPDWAATYDATLAKAEKGEVTADPTAACLPGGMPRIMNAVYPIEIIQKPQQMTIIVEWASQVRRIFLNGRPHPEDPDPTFNGHSIGHWEGDVLVVDTIALRGDTMLDQSGIRHSDKMHLFERFTLVDPQTLTDQITVDDPVAFTKPWTVLKTFKRAPKADILEYVCEENNRNPVDKNGVTTVLRPK
jgi:hypothetical protein